MYNNENENGRRSNGYNGNNGYHKSYNNGNGYRKSNNGGKYNNGYKKRYNSENGERIPQVTIPSQTDKAERIAKLVELQKRNLEVIKGIVEFLNTKIAEQDTPRVTMKDILTYVNGLGFNSDDTTPVSQINYMLKDLANAQKNKYIDDDRVTIRIMYIKEILKTNYRREVYDEINNLFNNNALFKVGKVEEEKNEESTTNTTADTLEEKA